MQGEYVLGTLTEILEKAVWADQNEANIITARGIMYSNNRYLIFMRKSIECKSKMAKWQSYSLQKWMLHNCFWVAKVETQALLKIHSSIFFHGHAVCEWAGNIINRAHKKQITLLFCQQHSATSGQGFFRLKIALVMSEGRKLACCYSPVTAALYGSYSFTQSYWQSERYSKSRSTTLSDNSSPNSVKDTFNNNIEKYCSTVQGSTVHTDDLLDTSIS